MSYKNFVAHGAMFHYFYNAKHYRGQGSISGADFEKIINFIGLSRIINPSEWLERIDNGKLKNHDICITLDDSLACQFDVALPILEKYNLKAFWFPYSNVFEGQINKLEVYRLFRSQFFKNIEEFYEVFFKKVHKSKSANKARSIVDKKNINDYRKIYPFYSFNDVKFRFIRDRALQPSQYEYIMDALMSDQGVKISEIAKDLWMTVEDLKYLNSTGHVIGLHSYSHPTNMARLSFKEQAEEYEKNYEFVKKIIGRPPTSMAHSVNSYNKNTLRVLEQLNIACGFKSNMLPGHISHKVNGSKYEMVREDVANIIRIKNENK